MPPENMNHDLALVASRFQLGGRFLDAAPHGSGHINDTYASRVATPQGVRRYVHQRINTNIFRQPEQLMDNVVRVTRHLGRKIAEAGGNPQREALTVVPALDGRPYWKNEAGNFWRTYLFIEGARSYDIPPAPEAVYEAARAFGRFQRLLSELAGPRLNETIPYFHDTPRRMAAFDQALAADVANRAASARREIEFAQAHRAEAGRLVDLLAAGKVPERITHNDTKFNNAMLDDRTGRGVCVIDLDTVMPGLAMSDFGDAVRTGATPAAEDERDLSRVVCDLEMFDRLACGYLEEAGWFLTPAETAELAFSARLITFEIGLRFLTDYLAGDVYFKIHRPSQNHDRARAQFALVADMERKAAEMEAIVAKHLRRAPAG